VEVHEAARDPRYVQQVVDKVRHVADLARDDFAGVPHSLGVDPGQGKDFCRRRDRCDRVPELVRERCHEFVLAPVGLLQLFLGLLALVDVAIEKAIPPPRAG
jgi:hypothetical protein